MANNEEIKFLEFKEYSSIDNKKETDCLNKIEKELDKCWKNNELMEKAKYLGVHKEGEEFKAHWFVGIRWAKEDECVLKVLPKIPDLDYISMYLECLKSEKVSQHLDETFDCYPEEHLIPIEDRKIEISPLVVITFLKRLFDLSKGHIRLNYVTINENLKGKVKGKIKITETVRQNLCRFRLDRMVCNFSLFSVDCLENRILKLALEKASRYLFLKNLVDKSPIKDWLNYCRIIFENVSLVPITYRDFQSIHYSSFYKEYKELHRLAFLILKQFGFNIRQNIEKYQFFTPPFWIDMNKLFERYCETKLRKKYEVWAGYEHENLGRDFKVRPDFLIPERKIIIDCKYKSGWDWAEDEFRGDVYQVVSYSQHKAVRERLGLKEGIDLCKAIYILYPFSGNDDGVEEIDFEIIVGKKEVKKLEAFNVPIYKVKLRLPKLA